MTPPMPADQLQEKFWNPERMAIALKMVEEGHTSKEICEEVGAKSPKAVKSKLHKMGVIRPKVPRRGRGAAKPKHEPSKMKQLEDSGMIFEEDNLDIPPSEVMPKYLPVAPDSPEPISFRELKDENCKSMREDVGPALYCGIKTVHNSSWCQFHYMRYVAAVVRRSYR